MNDLQTTLIDRAVAHGSWEDGSARWINACNALLDGTDLHPGHEAAVRMILSKLGRICTGDPYFHDHWLDIQGYAQRGMEVSK